MSFPLFVITRFNIPGKVNNINQSEQYGIVAVDAAAAADTINGQQEKQPPYMKLIADCWEHIYDYLSSVVCTFLSQMKEICNTFRILKHSMHLRR